MKDQDLLQDIQACNAQQQAGTETQKPKAGGSQATDLVRLADDLPLFHCDDIAYVDLEINGHRETWELRFKRFRDYLTRKYYLTYGRTPNSQATEDALRTLSAKALFESERRQVFTRVAEHQNAIYLDLCTDDWLAIEITPHGWKVINNPPVRFIRRRGMKPLPLPVTGGSTDLLFRYLNVAGDDEKKLILGWLVQALRPRGPYPLIVFQGEQGTAKTTAARVLVELTDPTVAPVRACPRNEHDLLIAARNSWVVALDNLSGLRNWMSDALCRLATGGGFSTRELYTDTDEVLIDVQRPAVLNGIDDVATRPDLIDRSIVLTLAPIGENERLPETQFWRKFYRDAGKILGVILDGVSRAVRDESKIELPQLPRMADFAVWATAAETAFGYETGEFLRAFDKKRRGAIEAGLEGSIVAIAISSLIAHKPSWYGTMKRLLADLEPQIDERMQKSNAWPKTPRKLSSDLRRLATSFRAVGINIQIDEQRHEDGYHVSIEKDVNQRSGSSERSGYVRPEHSEDPNTVSLLRAAEHDEHSERSNSTLSMDRCSHCDGEGCDWCTSHALIER